MKKTLLFLCAFLLLVNVYGATDKKKRRQERREAFLRRQSKEALIPKGWATKLDAAQKTAREKNLPILVVITSTKTSNAARVLDRKVIQKPDFQKEITLYAVPVYLDAPKNGTSEAVAAELKKCTFFDGTVPCVALLDADLKVLARPRSHSMAAIISAAKETSKKMEKKRLRELKEGDGESDDAPSPKGSKKGSKGKSEANDASDEE